MTMEQTLQAQQAFFQSGTTLSVDWRIAMLKKLQHAICHQEAQIQAALASDLGKSDFESYMCEIGMVRNELRHMLRHLRRYARPRRARTPLAQFPARSYSLPCPYGNVLIMSPWNYPFLLTLGPLIDAIAAGNTAIVKPSAYAPATSRLIRELLEDCFPREFVAVITGGREENARLLQLKFDLIFFTGSQSVGKEVLRRAAEHLTPVVLELGGKSPCIVDQTADIDLAARRIVFGKFLNCGQTCVAPDYILCHTGVKDQLVQALQDQIRQQFGPRPLENPDYGKIINRKHFDRLCHLIDTDKRVTGGETQPEALRIAPTVLQNVSWQDAVMQEEIFGPILPVLTFDRAEEILEALSDRPKPLALYLFSQNRALIRQVTRQCRYGGGCINDVVVHLATEHMGFGGVGESGMGAYHGKTGFDTFSHPKAILDKKTWLDLPMRYQPYNRRHYGKLLRFFLK